MDVGAGSGPVDQTIAVGRDGVQLSAVVAVPPRVHGTVVFAHGSGSGRLSPRNRGVADVLVDAGFATVLMDLLTPREEAEDLRTARLRFDIPMLAERVVGVIDWIALDAAVGDLPPVLRDLPIGCFGASTGAAAALIAAAERPDRVRAVVSRGGRPDLAGEALPRVRAPTLLIVGGEDTEVIRLNRAAQARLGGESELAIIPGAGHLFEEPGALAQVAQLAREWFLRYLPGDATGEPNA
jgi:putative phosphoribosyl transferase